MGTDKNRRRELRELTRIQKSICDNSRNSRQVFVFLQIRVYPSRVAGSVVKVTGAIGLLGHGIQKGSRQGAEIFLKFFSKKVLQFLRTLLETGMPDVTAGTGYLVFERIPRGRVGSSRPDLRRTIVME